MADDPYVAAVYAVVTDYRNGAELLEAQRECAKRVEDLTGSVRVSGIAVRMLAKEEGLKLLFDVDEHRPLYRELLRLSRPALIVAFAKVRASAVPAADR